MAAWQVEFAIVPRRALAATPHQPISGIIDAEWWRNERLPASYAQDLAAVAPPESRSDTHRTWGKEDGNRVDVWSEKGAPTRVTAHVDVRKLDSRFGALLVQFARVAGAVLIRGDGLVAEPTAGAFAAALRSSAAWKFASDPAAHFASYAEPLDEDE